MKNKGFFYLFFLLPIQILIWVAVGVRFGIYEKNEEGKSFDWKFVWVPLTIGGIISAINCALGEAVRWGVKKIFGLKYT